METVRQRNHVLICGWNQHAEKVLDGLVGRAGHQAPVVLVNEVSEEVASEMLLAESDHFMVLVQFIHVSRNLAFIAELARHEVSFGGAVVEQLRIDGIHK